MLSNYFSCDKPSKHLIVFFPGIRELTNLTVNTKNKGENNIHSEPLPDPLERCEACKQNCLLKF